MGNPIIDKLQALSEAQEQLQALGIVALAFIFCGIALAVLNTINRRRDP